MAKDFTTLSVNDLAGIALVLGGRYTVEQLDSVHGSGWRKRFDLAYRQASESQRAFKARQPKGGKNRLLKFVIVEQDAVK